MDMIRKVFLVMTAAAIIITECACGSSDYREDSGTGNSYEASSGTENSYEASSGTESADYEDSRSEGTQNLAEETESETQERQEGNVKVQVQMPEGWDEVSGSVLNIQYLKGTASFFVKEENFGGMNLDDVVKAAEDIFSTSFDTYAPEGEAESITIDEKDARKLMFTCSINGMKMKYCYIYLYAGDRLFAMTFADLADAFDEITPDLEHVQANIRFVTD